jgi:thiol:disulfide interchange protein
MVLMITTGASVSHAQIAMDALAKPKSYVVYAAEAQSVVAGRQSMLELRFQVAEPYHINSHTPNSELLIPTTLTLDPASGVKAGALVYPPGHAYSFPFDLKDKVDVYSGSFVVKLPLVAAAGEHTITGSLRYQACDNASCYPPKTVPVKIVFTAK